MKFSTDSVWRWYLLIPTRKTESTRLSFYSFTLLYIYNLNFSPLKNPSRTSSSSLPSSVPHPQTLKSSPVAATLTTTTLTAAWPPHNPILALRPYSLLPSRYSLSPSLTQHATHESVESRTSPHRRRLPSRRHRSHRPPLCRQQSLSLPHAVPQRHNRSTQ